MIPYNIGDDFHVYRFEAIGEHIRVLIDGDEALNETHLFPGGGTKTLLFGDGSTSFTTYSEWDYFRMTVPLPEPSTMAMLPIATIFLSRRRSN